MKQPTAKQRAFAMKIIEGKNPSEAYRETYRAANMNASSVAHEASKLLKRPHITHLIEKGVEMSIQNAAWCRAKAIEQLEKVNQRCFSALTADDKVALDKAALSGFLETTDRLNELCFVGTEVEDARATYKASPERLRRHQDESTRVFEAEMAAIGF